MGTASAPAQAPPLALSDRLVRPPVLGAVLAFLAIAPVAAGQGGFYPVAWGWMGLVYAWAGGVAAVLRREIRLSTTELVTLTGALAVVLWTAATLLWTSNTTSTALEVERVLAYLAFVAALLFACERAAAIGLLVGTWAAVTLVAVYSLGTRLAPASFGLYTDPLGPGRLFQPLGYWNALGIFCAMGIALAVGLADRPGRILLRAVAAASIAPLAATAYFTFSRGAWIALALGVAAVVLLNPKRLRYLVTALVVLPLPALAVLYAASIPELTIGSVQPSLTGGVGGRAALIIAAAAVVTAALTVGLAVIQSRVSVPILVRRGFAGALVLVGLACLAGGVARYGSPVSQAHRLYDSLTAPPPPVATGSDLNNRLLNLSLNGRPDVWRAAVDQYHDRPIVGQGAGTFGAYWLAHRKVPGFVANAHSLYLQTLGEQGIVGLAALLLLLVPPLVAAVRFRSSAEVTVALGAYVAFLAHAMVDWDWEVSAVTLVALAAAVAMLVAARPPAARPVSRGLRWSALAVFVAVALFAVLGLSANRALSNGASALARGDTGGAIADARTARRFAPWSDAPDILAGQAHRVAKQNAAARASFARATREEPGDWVAWQWLARSTIGAPHTRAIAVLRKLDPLYDFVNGRP